MRGVKGGGSILRERMSLKVHSTLKEKLEEYDFRRGEAFPSRAGGEGSFLKKRVGHEPQSPKVHQFKKEKNGLQGKFAMDSSYKGGVPRKFQKKPWVKRRASEPKGGGLHLKLRKGFN